MTLQDIFSIVWDHYLVEKNPPGARPSANNNGSTRWLPYYGGANAENKDPVTLFDTESVLLNSYGTLEYIAREYPEKLEAVCSNFPKGGVPMLIEIQSAHDNAVMYHGISEQFYPLFEQSLRLVARQFKVEVPNAA